jgi:hypothetical protein
MADEFKHSDKCRALLAGHPAIKVDVDLHLPNFGSVEGV